MAIVNYYKDVDKQSVFFESRQRLNVLENILKSIKDEAEVIVFTGEVGTGKTLFAEKILQSLDIDFASVKVAEHDGSYESVVSALYENLKFVEAESDAELGVEDKLRIVQGYLDSQYAVNRPVLLSVDNAQDLSVAALSQLILLAKPQDNQQLLFKLLLVGLPSLNNALADPAILALSNKQPDCHRLDPLGLEEVKAFIRLRLERYKFKEKELFSPQVLAIVLTHTNGLLRLLDSLFDSVILFTDSSNKITQAGFNEAVDFFSLLVRPSMLKSENQTPKSLFYNPNEQAEDDLVSSLKEKVTHIFSNTKPEPEPAQESVNEDKLYSSFENVVPLVNMHYTVKMAEALGPDTSANQSAVDDVLGVSLPDVPEVNDVVTDDHADVFDDTGIETETLLNEVKDQVLAEDRAATISDEGVIASSETALSESGGVESVHAVSRDDNITSTENSAAEVLDKQADEQVYATTAPLFADTEYIKEAMSTPDPELTLTGMVLGDYEESAADLMPLGNDKAEYLVANEDNNYAADASSSMVFKSIVNQEVMMSRSENLSAALKSLKDMSPDIEAAALISDDGLIIVSVLPQDLDETRVGAMSATLLSLGTRSATTLKRGKLEEVIVKGEYGYAALMNAGRGTMLLAVTNENAKPGLVFFDMREAIEKINKIL